MDEIKIRNFIAAHPGAEPPRARHLEPEECEFIRTQLSRKIGLSAHAEGLTILQSIGKLATDVPDIRPSRESFSISNLLKDQKIEDNLIYLNWYRFDDIDEISLEALDSAFHDIWYPDSDDIELFSSSLDWIMLVRHFDVIQICRLRPE